MSIPNFPKIAYTSKDYASFRESMLENVADNTGSASGSFIEWTAARDPSPNDFGVALIEAFAYWADIASWYNDRVALEAYLDTASLRSSVLSIARSLDYAPISANPANVSLIFTVATGNGTITIPAGTTVSTPSGQPDICPVITFETDTSLVIQQNPTTMTTGTVTATEGQTVLGENAGASNGTPNQTYALIQGAVINGSLTVKINEGAGDVTWDEVEHLIDASQFDLVYSTATDAADQTSVMFGDGVTGKVPVIGSTVSVNYRTGGGLLGNVGVGTISELVNYIPGVVPPSPAVGFNGTAATGGTDTESIENIRRNAPRALTTLKRCVTLRDHANVVLGIKQVAKSNAEGLSYTNVLLYACNYSGVLDAGLKQSIQDYLVDKLMAGGQVSVLPPVFVNFLVTAVIRVNSRFPQAATLLTAKTALNNAFSFANVDFAQKIYGSDIYSILLNVPGVDSADVLLLTRSAASTTTLGVLCAPSEIPALSPDGVTLTAAGGVVPVVAPPIVPVVPHLVPNAPVLTNFVGSYAAVAFNVTCNTLDTTTTGLTFKERVFNSTGVLLYESVIGANAPGVSLHISRAESSDSGGVPAYYEVIAADTAQISSPTGVGYGPPSTRFTLTALVSVPSGGGIYVAPLTWVGLPGATTTVGSITNYVQIPSAPNTLIAYPNSGANSAGWWAADVTNVMAFNASFIYSEVWNEDAAGNQYNYRTGYTGTGGAGGSPGAASGPQTVHINSSSDQLPVQTLTRIAARFRGNNPNGNGPVSATVYHPFTDIGR